MRCARHYRRLAPGEPAETVGGRHQLLDDSRLERRVPGVGDDAEFGLRPSLVKGISRHRRAHDVVAALHNDAGDRLQLVGVFEEEIVARKEPAIDEIMTFNAGKCLGKSVLVVMRFQTRIRQKL